MAKKAHVPSAETPAESEAIAAAIHRLADAIVVLRDVIADIREDFQWVTHNGLPVQPIVHTVVKRMALDPCDPHWSDKLLVERYSFPSDSSEESTDSDALDRIREDLATTVEAVAQGQLDIVLTALDGVRDEILAALKRGKEPMPAATPVPAVETPAATSAPAVDASPRPTRPRDRLF